MKKQKTKLQLEQEKAEAALKKTNMKIDELGLYSEHLYMVLDALQKLFDIIRNVPHENLVEYKRMKEIRHNWKMKADKIEADYKAAEVKSAGGGIAGVGTGVAVAALGPTAAMGVATTFGVASTGTAISALHGAAATNAALAWLGGGTLATGGGGMAAGSAILTMAGPVGWTIAGCAVLGSALMFWKSKSEKEKLENTFTLISARDEKSYQLAIVELSERITRIKQETELLNQAITDIKKFGTDYDQMTEQQQYMLGSYLNLMNSSTMLLVNPIIGLTPKYNEEDYEQFMSESDNEKMSTYSRYKDVIISLCNLLYKVNIDQKDRKLLTKSIKKNKDFLQVMKIEKKDFDENIMEVVALCLKDKYSKEKTLSKTAGFQSA